MIYNVLVVGVGNMGSSHARAYHKIDKFNLVGLVSRTPKKRMKLSWWYIMLVIIIYIIVKIFS